MKLITIISLTLEETGQLSWYRDRLWAEWPKNRGSISGSVKIFFILFPKTSVPSQGPILLPVPRLFSMELKRHACEADLSPPSSADVKKGGAIAPVPHTSWL
jgi:hypothetical protein